MMEPAQDALERYPENRIPSYNSHRQNFAGIIFSYKTDFDLHVLDLLRDRIALRRAPALQIVPPRPQGPAFRECRRLGDGIWQRGKCRPVGRANLLWQYRDSRIIPDHRGAESNSFYIVFAARWPDDDASNCRITGIGSAIICPICRIAPGNISRTSGAP